MATLQIGVFLGSLRRESFSRKIANVVAGMLPDDFAARTVDIGALGFYNQDYDEGKSPQEWVDFRREVQSLDGLLFVTPEYNRSLTPVLKNALDIASRPMGQNVWNGKPGAIMGISPGQLGGFGSSNHFRQTMTFLNIFLMSQPEAYISNVGSLFNERGELTNETTKDFLRRYADAFAQWVHRFAGQP